MERTPLPNPLPTSWGEGTGKSDCGSVEIHPVMCPDDLQEAGLDAIGKKWC